MNIYLTENIHDYAYEKLKKYFKIVSDCSICDGVITRNVIIDKKWMDNSPNLKIIVIHGSGTDCVDVNEANKRGIRWFNVPKENSLSVAELNVGLMLDISRNISKGYVRYLDGLNELAPKYLSGYELFGKTCGFLGLGNISVKTARILHDGFNMNIIGYSKSKKNIDFIKEVSLEDVLKLSDYVLLGLSLNDETKYIIDYEKLLLMKNTAFLVNTARGALIKTDDLIRALDEKRILGYAADVFEYEPISKKHPLLRHNVILLPHIGANTDEALYRVGIRCINILIDFFNL